MEKKERGLIFWYLSALSLKYYDSSPWVALALEQVHEGMFPENCAYSLIRIQEDEWKSTFFTGFGHYAYLIMPYGLVNAPSVPSLRKKKYFMKYFIKLWLHI